MSSGNIFGIAGVQMPISSQQENITLMERYASQVRNTFPWVRMLLFSELAPFGLKQNAAVPLPGEVEKRLCEIAKKNNLWLIPGSMFERRDDEVFNTALIINPDGYVVNRFRKLFPFLPYESGVSAGSEHVVFDVPGAGRFGVSICYDMWFPETTRQLVALGAEVIIHPTLTTTIDREVELSIVKSSAAVNQVYFFDINGLDDGGCGRSIVVDCAGYVLHQADSCAQIIPVEVDFGKLRRERETGLRGLGQPLKSFRDRKVNFPVYADDRSGNVELSKLGPLVMPASELE